MRRSRIAETLRAAAGLVRVGWTQGAYARNAAGEKVPAEDQHAVCWCASGAIGRVTVERRARRAADVWFSRWLGWSVTSYNDTRGRTAEEVACALEAAAVAREERRRGNAA